MLETERLKIIPLEERHLPLLRKMRSDKDTWYWLTNVSPINEIKQVDWFEKMSNDPTKIYFAIENKDTGTFIGILRADEWDKVNRSIRIGVDIDKTYRQKGFGKEAFLEFIKYFFLHLNIHRIWLLVAEYNKVAQELYKKIGFKLEGIQGEALFRNGKYRDYLMFSLIDKDYFDKYGS
ncbi:MAG: GNAT family protein [Actinomycetota bacterium]